MVLFTPKQTPGYLLSWGTPMSPGAGCNAVTRVQRERSLGSVALSRTAVVAVATEHAKNIDLPTVLSAPSGWIT